MGICLLVALAAPSHALLTTISTADYNGGNYNLIYDNDSPYRSIVWFDFTPSPNDWDSQMRWASSLDDTGTVNYHFNAGISMEWGGGWQLPNTVPIRFSVVRLGSCTPRFRFYPPCFVTLALLSSLLGLQFLCGFIGHLIA